MIYSLPTQCFAVGRPRIYLRKHLPDAPMGAEMTAMRSFTNSCCRCCRRSLEHAGFCKLTQIERGEGRRPVEAAKLTISFHSHMVITFPSRRVMFFFFTIWKYSSTTLCCRTHRESGVVVVVVVATYFTLRTTPVSPSVLINTRHGQFPWLQENLQKTMLRNVDSESLQRRYNLDTDRWFGACHSPRHAVWGVEKEEQLLNK